MKQVIYADIIFLLNFCMDFLALFAAGKILGLKLSSLRLILASTLGAVYCIFTFLYDYSIIPEMIINILVSIIMCFVAYNINSLIKFTKIFVIFYAACFMLGGGIEALYYLSGLVKTEDVIGGPDFNTSFFTVQTIIIFAGISTVLIIFAGMLFKRRSSVKDTEIIIGFMGKEVKIDTIVDSGNLLYEPISSLPVIIVTLQSTANLFDMNTIEFFAGDAVGYLNKLSGENIEAALKFRIVPIKSVMDTKAILPAFSPEYIKYRAKNKHGKDGKYLTINAIVAVDNKNNTTYGEKYSGIIPATLID